LFGGFFVGWVRNFYFIDGSVKTYRDVTFEDPRMGEVRYQPNSTGMKGHLPFE
jgi:hypothetical protein